jgi:hypothetical protein
MTRTDNKRLTYAIGTLPKEVTWGNVKEFDDKSSILCKSGTNNPCTIWILGKTSKTWFFDRNGPAEQVSISIVPLDPEDGITARKLLANHSHPNIRTPLTPTLSKMNYLHSHKPASTGEGWGNIRATRWQTERMPGNPSGIVRILL